MKKVLYITYDGLTDPLGQSQILPYLRHLSQQGYQFTILSFEKKARYQKEGALIKSITESYGINWAPLFFTANPPILSKMYDRHQMWQTVLSLHKKHKFDLTHCRSYIAAEMGLRLKQRFGVKFLFDMRGFWADEKVDNGQWNLKKPLYKYIYQHYKKKEAEFLLKADGIVSLTQAGKEYILGQKAYRNLSISVIPCCADLQHFNYQAVSEEEVNKQKAHLGIPAQAKVITYLGSVGGWYMTKEMFDFFALLSAKYPEYVMLVLTKDDPEIVKQEAERSGVLPEKLFVTYSTRQQLPAYLGMCESSVFFIRPTFSKKASSPTKHAELMGMGIPVVCNDIGDTGNIIHATQTGILINKFDREELVNGVEQYERLQEVSKATIRASAQQLFDLEAGSEKYLQLYRTILENPKAPTNYS
ncbi:glycosyltransferase [Flavisolibacter tropicus]|uniref:glycosyltransferase n=1 Tax=Flavisolibacter tropicus TaxID=1492898 RepID=UPI00082DF5A2|nr:glycosyltransferase [Flavisolibacter tropicus]